jgi:hypothetical protein
MCAACPPHHRCLSSPVNRAATIPYFPHFTNAGDSSLWPSTRLVCRPRSSSPSGRSPPCPSCHLPVTGAPPHHSVSSRPTSSRPLLLVTSPCIHPPSLGPPRSSCSPHHRPPQRTDEVHPSRCCVILACHHCVLLARQVCEDSGTLFMKTLPRAGHRRAISGCAMKHPACAPMHPVCAPACPTGHRAAPARRFLGCRNRAAWPPCCRSRGVFGWAGADCLFCREPGWLRLYTRPPAGFRPMAPEVNFKSFPISRFDLNLFQTLTIHRKFITCPKIMKLVLLFF